MNTTSLHEQVRVPRYRDMKDMITEAAEKEIQLTNNDDSHLLLENGISLSALCVRVRVRIRACVPNVRVG